MSECWISYQCGRYDDHHSIPDDYVSTVLASLGHVSLTYVLRGPYYTSWSSGQAREFPTWTGLTQYAEQFFPTETPVFGPVETDSSSSGTPTSSASSSNASAASASAQATSAPNAGTVQVASNGLVWVISILGIVGLL
jgi:hypothetical protein